MTNQLAENRNKMFIVAVDGTDCSGKSTLITELREKLKKILNPEDFDILQFHFPAYDNETGKRIKELLYQCKNADDPTFLHDMIKLQILNREEFFNKFPYKALKKKHTILLFDRFRASNDFYNVMKLTEANIDLSKENHVLECYMKDIEEVHQRETEDLGVPEPDVQIYAVCDFLLQMKRLHEKENKDHYEDLGNIKKVTKEFIQYIKLCNGVNKMSFTGNIPKAIAWTENLDKDFIKNNAYLPAIRDRLDIYTADYLAEKTIHYLCDVIIHGLDRKLHPGKKDRDNLYEDNFLTMMTRLSAVEDEIKFFR